MRHTAERLAGVALTGFLLAACGEGIIAEHDLDLADGSPDGLSEDAPAAGEPGSLRSLTSSSLTHVGVAVDVALLRADPVYRALVAREYNSVTAENAMKWGSIQPTTGTWSFADADYLVERAAAAGQRVRGHTLVWHQQMPPWIVESMSGSALDAALDAFIDRMVSRYRGRVTSWDVVNEAIDDGGRMRDTIFLRKLGAQYVADAFRRARAADPGAELVYNDYDIEWPNAKSDAVYELLRSLRAAGVPVDAVGFQGHVRGYDFASHDIREEELRQNIRRFAAIGLRVHLTELDMRIANLPGSRSARLDYQRRAYQRLVAICRSEPGCHTVTFWGASDRDSWIDDWFGPDDPLLHDDQLQPKPARQGVADGLAGASGAGFDGGLVTRCGTTLAASTWCAPFEALDLGRNYTSLVSGSFDLTPTSPARGARSLHTVAAPGAGAQAVIGRRASSPRRSGTLYLRANVRVPTFLAAESLVLMAMGEGDPPYHGVSVGLYRGKLQLGFTTANHYPVSSIELPRGSWQCLTLAVSLGETSGSATIGLNGASVLTTSGVDTVPVGGISNGNVGVLYVAPATASGEAWFDDVAFGTTPLACP